VHEHLRINKLYYLEVIYQLEVVFHSQEDNANYKYWSQYAYKYLEHIDGGCKRICKILLVVIDNLVKGILVIDCWIEKDAGKKVRIIAEINGGAVKI